MTSRPTARQCGRCPRRRAAAAAAGPHSLPCVTTSAPDPLRAVNLCPRPALRAAAPHRVAFRQRKAAASAGRSLIKEVRW